MQVLKKFLKNSVQGIQSHLKFLKILRWLFMVICCVTKMIMFNIITSQRLLLSAKGAVERRSSRNVCGGLVTRLV